MGVIVYWKASLRLVVLVAIILNVWQSYFNTLRVLHVFVSFFLPAFSSFCLNGAKKLTVSLTNLSTTESWNFNFLISGAWTILVATTSSSVIPFKICFGNFLGNRSMHIHVSLPESLLPVLHVGLYYGYSFVSLVRMS